MSDAQIWVAIILGFVVLITAAAKLRRSEAPWAVRMQHEQKEGKEVNERLDALADDSAEIKRRLISIEQTLKEVE